MAKLSTKLRMRSDAAAWEAAKAGPVPAVPAPSGSFNDRRLVDMEPARGTISHLKARKIAADWHGGGNTGLAGLATSGAVPPGTPEEVAENFNAATTKKDAAQLQQLHRYTTKNEGRGPVRGWSELNW